MFGFQAFLMSLCSDGLAHTTQCERTVNRVVKVWGTEVKHHVSFLLLWQCFTVIKRKKRKKRRELELVKPCVCLAETKWTRIQCEGEVSGPGPKLQSPLAWLPHFAAEWRGVRCGHSGVKVCSSGTQIIMKVASAWSLKLHCPACPSGSATQLFGKNKPVRSTGSVNGYPPRVTLNQARPLNY